MIVTLDRHVRFHSMPKKAFQDVEFGPLGVDLDEVRLDLGRAQKLPDVETANIMLHVRALIVFEQRICSGVGGAFVQLCTARAIPCCFVDRDGVSSFEPFVQPSEICWMRLKGDYESPVIANQF